MTRKQFQNVIDNPIKNITGIKYRKLSKGCKICNDPAVAIITHIDPKTGKEKRTGLCRPCSDLVRH